MTLKDKHHGTWSVDKDLIKLKWDSVDGYADFKITWIQEPDNEYTIECVSSGWEFMRTWSIVNQDSLNKIAAVAPPQRDLTDEEKIIQESDIMEVDPLFNLDSLMIEKQWLAGKTGLHITDESLIKNPWIFNQNGTFMTMRDKHHGVWSTESNNLLNLRWNSYDSHASFKVN